MLTANQGGVFFLDGPWETGKTFVYKLFCWSTCCPRRQCVRMTSSASVVSSGLAATLLLGGTTAHSRFKIPIPIDRDSTCSFNHQLLAAHQPHCLVRASHDAMPLL